MLADQKFIFALSTEQKKRLEFLAKHEGRSQGNLIKRLIDEHYEKLAPVESVASPRPDQIRHMVPTP